jgi:hypothetical protein
VTSKPGHGAKALRHSQAFAPSARATALLAAKIDFPFSEVSPVNRAKRRDKNQRIGRVGELTFATWATENQLSANKIEEDFGTDYMCEELQAVTATADEITGNNVFCQVRATEGSDVPRIAVTREDVETALRQKTTYCLVGVHEKSKRVFFKFLDEGLLVAWSDFLYGQQKTTSFRLDQMDSDPAFFLAELRRLSRPIARMKLARLRAEIGITQLLPGAALSLSYTDAAEHAIVTAPRFGNIWDTKTEEDVNAIAKSFFSLSPLEVAVAETSKQFRIHPNLVRLAELTDGAVHLAAPMERQVTLFVEGESRATVTATVRQFQDRRAYILKSGLALHISEPKQNNGARYHEVAFEILDKGASPLNCDDLAFLRELRPGAKINEEGRPGVDVEAFGVEQIGKAVRAVEDVSRKIQFPLGDFLLSDFKDDDFVVNLGVLAALLVRSPAPAPRGFVFGVPDGDALATNAWRNCLYVMPVILGFKGRTLCIWLRGNGELYMPGGTIHGMRFAAPDETIHELKDFAPVGGPRAAMYAVKEWPPIPLTVESEYFSVRRDGDLPLEGAFELVP